jgi:short-subunit dehydrogenase
VTDPESRARVFRFLAPVFAAAAVFHAAAFVRPGIAEPMPRWFHALFVAVNLLLVAGILRRPRGFVVAYALYTIQQLVEHGERGSRIWSMEHRLDWASLVSVAFVPIVLVLLAADARAKRRAGGPGGNPARPHALITGASSGIGEALAKAFAAEGYDLTLVARRRAELERVVASLVPSAKAEILVADLADLGHEAEIVARAEAARGAVDVLVNNAGVQIVHATEDVSVARSEALFTLNVLAPFRFTRSVLPGMLARGRGTIVDVASLAALGPTPGMFDYSASKAALAAGSECLRAEVKGRGVHVVTVYPGPIVTAMANAAAARYAKDPTAGMPVGNTGALARLVVRAVERRQDRVIYPRVYAVTRMFPGLARWAIDTFGPLPQRRADGESQEAPSERGGAERSDRDAF